MKVIKLSALRLVYLYPHEISLVLISVRDRVDLTAIVRPAGHSNYTVGNRTHDLQLVAQCHNQLRQCVSGKYGSEVSVPHQ